MKRKADAEDCLDRSTLPATKRIRLEDQQNDMYNIFSTLPDGVLALVLSNCYVTSEEMNEGYPVFTFDTEQRLVCQRFRRVIGDSVPCFAMLKLLMSEYDRVSSTNDNTDTDTRDQESPWLTPTEVSMITSKRLIDLNEPLPSPHLMPLTALQVVASSVWSEIRLLKEYAEDSYVEKPTLNTQQPVIMELIYAVAGVGVFIQTINDEKSPINGKQIIVQKVTEHSRTEPCSELTSRVMVEDTETANLLGIEPNTICNAAFVKEFRYRDAMHYHPLLAYSSSCSFNGFSGLKTRIYWLSMIDNITVCKTKRLAMQLNLHYRRNKSLWDQFPPLPPAVYQFLTSNEANESDLVRLIAVIRTFKLNVIFKRHTSSVLRQLYCNRIEASNVEYIIDNTIVIARCLPQLGIVKFRSGKEWFRMGADGMINQEDNDDLKDMFAVLNAMDKLDLPVILTPVDFARMLHVLIGNKIEEFNLSEQLGTNVQYFRSKSVQWRSKFLIDEPSDEEIYSEYDDSLKQTIHFHTCLTNTVDHYMTHTAVLQLLRRDNRIWFRIRFSKVYQNPNSDEITLMKPYDLPMAKDLFDYWLAHLTASNFIRAYSNSFPYIASTYTKAFPDFVWESNSSIATYRLDTSSVD